MTGKEQFEMKLNEENWESQYGIRRVPGGWLYMTYDASKDIISSMAFVPLNNEFVE